MANDLQSKSVSVYIDDAPAQAAYDRLSKKADTYNQKIDDAVKKQQALISAINKAGDSGKSTDSLQKRLDSVTATIDKNRAALAKVTDQQKLLQQQLDSKSGPSLKQQQALVTRLENEYKNLGQNTEEAAKKLEELGKQNAVLQQMKDRLNSVKNAQEESSGGFASILKNVVEYGTAFFAFDKIKETLTGFFESAIDEADQAAEAVDGLKNSLENVGRLDLLQPLLDQADEFAEKYKRLDNDDITGVFTKLVDYGKLTKNQMTDLTDVIINFAAKEKVSLADATDTITKALEGSAKGLKTYGVNLTDASTVTERYNIVVDQLGKKVRGAEEAFERTPKGIKEMFAQSIRDAQEAVGTFLYSLTGLADQQFKIAVAAKQEADQAQVLVTRYEELSKKTNKTAADKQELQNITASLASTFGSSVVQINKETGALELNVQATKDLITQKLLLASDAAATEANKYRKAIQDQKDAQDEATKSLAILQTKQKEYGETAEQAGKKVQLSFSGLGTGGLQDSRTAQEKELSKLQADYYNASKKVDDATGQIKNSISRLKDLGFNANDVNKLINPTIDPNAVVGNGNPDKDSAADKEAAKKAEEARKKLLADTKKLYEELAKLSREYSVTTEDEEAKEVEQAKEKYLALVDLAHGNKEELKKIEEGYQIAVQQIEAKYAQKRLDEAIKRDAEMQQRRKEFFDNAGKDAEAFIKRFGAILSQGQDKAFRDQLAKLQDDVLKSSGLKRLKANQELLDKQEEQELANTNLTENEKQLIRDKYDQSREQQDREYWTGIADVVLSYAQQALQILDNFNQARTLQENAQLKKDLAQYDQRKAADKRLLNNKLISQQEYNKRSAQYDAEADKKKQDLEKKQFERNKRTQKAQVWINLAQGVSKAIAEYAWPASLVPIAFDVTEAAAQIAVINKQQYDSDGASFGKGGKLGGPSHANGGMPVINPVTGRKEAEVEGGEVILSKKTVQNNGPLVDALLYSSMYREGSSIQPWFRTRAYQSIDFEGVSRSIQRARYFENGGTLNFSSSQDGSGGQPSVVVPAMTEEQQQLWQALYNFIQTPPKAYVVFSDIEAAGNQLNQIREDATFK